jgi:hypothetical protein
VLRGETKQGVEEPRGGWCGQHEENREQGQRRDRGRGELAEGLR